MVYVLIRLFSPMFNIVCFLGALRIFCSLVSCAFGMFVAFIGVALCKARVILSAGLILFLFCFLFLWLLS